MPETRAQTPNWNYDSTGITHEFYFPTDMIVCSTDSLEIGDFIGIFYDSLGINFSCAGYIVWDGGDQSIWAIGDDTLTTAKEGFVVDEQAYWKTFHVAANIEYFHTPIYAHDGYYVDSNRFVVNGGSKLLYLGNCVAPVFQKFTEGPSCYGAVDGSAWINIIVSSPPDTVRWSDGTINDSIINKPAGIYQVSVTNALGYMTVENVYITEPDSLTIGHTCHPYTQTTFPNGSIDITVLGGTPPYFYTWDNGATSPHMINLFPGYYKVTISDTHLCTKADSVEVLFMIPDPWLVIPSPVEHEITFLEHTTVVFNGGFIQNGDVVAVFYDSLGVSRCAGKFQYNDGFGSEGTILTAYGDVSSTFPEKEGFAQAEAFNWKIWDASDAQEYDVFASYIDSVIWPEHGDFAMGGKSGVIMLSDIEHDMGISAWISPNSYCGLSNSDTLILEVFSEGMAPVDWFYLKYSVNGGPWVSDSIVQQMNYLDTLQIALAIPADLEAPIDYHLKAYIELLDDSNSHNDSIELFLAPMQVSSQAIPDTMSFCVGQASIEIDGGTSPYTITWNDPISQIGGTAIDLCTGAYLAHIVDKKGCGVYEEVIVENILPPTFNFLMGNVSCQGGHNGFIYISLVHFKLPLSFAWSNGSISQNLTNLFPGTYLVTITDGTSLSVSGTFTITQPDSLSLSYSSENNICYGDETGSIDIDMTGGTKPYHYLWSNGSQQADISQLPGGNYIVTVTDAHSCVVTQYVYISQPSQIVVNFIISDISTANAGDGSIALSMFGGKPPYSFQWSTGESHQNLSMLEQGYYSLTVIDADNCERNFDSLFIFEPYPVISGRVFMGPNLASDGVVVLFEEFQDQHIEAIDFTYVSNGYYSFSVPPNGKYLIYALPNPNYGVHVYPQYFPTYFDTDIRWAYSSRIETETDYAHTDIHLSSYEDIFYGPASVSGNLSYIDPAVYEPDVFNHQWFNVSFVQKSAGPNPARNIPILLLNENRQPVMFRLTDSEGNFTLSHVEYGEYILRAEKAGYEPEEIPIYLSADHSTIDNIRLFIQPSEIVVGIADDYLFNPSALTIFPNPVNDLMLVQLPVSGIKIKEIVIYTVEGEKIITLAGNEIQSKSILWLKTTELKPGVYILDIETKENIKLKNKFIKI